MHLKINSNCYFTELDDKAIVLNTSSGFYYELDEKSCYIWKMVEKNYEYEEIISLYKKKFLFSREESVEALDAFISKAKEESFLV